MADLALGNLPGLEGEGVEVGVEEEGDLDGHVEEHEALGADRVGENLDGVADEEAGPAAGVEDAVHPDEEDHAGVGTRGLVLLVEAAGEGPEEESDQHAASGEQEGEAAVDALGEQGAAGGDDDVEDGLAGAQNQAVVLLLHARVLVETGRVVGDDTVAGPLGEEAEGDQDAEAVAVALGLEEVDVLGAGVGDLLHLDGVADLVELELHGGVVDVAVGVVLGEDRKGLVIAVMGDQPTGRFGNPWGGGRWVSFCLEYRVGVGGGSELTEEEHELDEAGNTLDKGGEAPLPVVPPEVGAVTGPGHQKRPQVPETVVDGGETGAVLRVGDLGEEHGRGDLGEGVSETEEDTTGGVDGEVRGGGLHSGATGHDDEARADGGLATPLVGDEWDDGDGDDGADLVEGHEEAEIRALGLAEEIVPAVKVLDHAHVHARVRVLVLIATKDGRAWEYLPVPASGHGRGAEHNHDHEELLHAGILEHADFLKLKARIVLDLLDLIIGPNDQLLNLVETHGEGEVGVIERRRRWCSCCSELKLKDWLVKSLRSL